MGLINLSKKELLNKIEFGDFQTPKVLADLMSFIIKDKYNYSPNCIIEPTCGKGSILVSAVKTFTNCNKNIGIEINSNYLEELENISKKDNLKLTLLNQDFFTIDLKAK
ncbi:MAG TPA: N-6 DNA methylase [Leptospiraceae bacterium]|nr:N-6 DNA methylase [Leptospiraceae bacterium]